LTKCVGPTDLDSVAHEAAVIAACTEHELWVQAKDLGPEAHW